VFIIIFHPFERSLLVESVVYLYVKFDTSFEFPAWSIAVTNKTYSVSASKVAIAELRVVN